MSWFVWHHFAPCVGDENSGSIIDSGSSSPPHTRAWRLTGIGLLALVLGISLCGCGGDSGPTLVQLSGTILFEGHPIPPGTLTFIPKEGKGPTATGTISDAGHFTVSTHRPGDGIVPGEYRIRVESWETPPTMGGPPAKSAVPAKYTNINTTDLTLAVPNEREQVVARLRADAALRRRRVGE